MFEEAKKRADSPSLVAYAYDDEAGASYEEKLASVEPVDPDDCADYRKSDVEIDIARIRMTIADLIGEGYADGKMALAAATAKACGISKSKAIRIITESTGNIPGQHIWNTETGPRNTQCYRLIIFDRFTDPSC